MKNNILKRRLSLQAILTCKFKGEGNYLFGSDPGALVNVFVLICVDLRAQGAPSKAHLPIFGLHSTSGQSSDAPPCTGASILVCPVARDGQLCCELAIFGRRVLAWPQLCRTPAPYSSTLGNIEVDSGNLGIRLWEALISNSEKHPNPTLRNEIRFWQTPKSDSGQEYDLCEID